MQQPQILKTMKESSNNFCHHQANIFANLNKTVDFLGKKI